MICFSSKTINLIRYSDKGSASLLKPWGVGSVLISLFLVFLKICLPYQNVIRTTKASKIWWATNEARMGRMTNLYLILIRKTPLMTPHAKRVIQLKFNIRGIFSKQGITIYFLGGRGQWFSVTHMIMQQLKCSCLLKKFSALCSQFISRAYYFSPPRNMTYF